MHGMESITMDASLFIQCSSIFHFAVMMQSKT